jgi:hypothetical protein
MNTGEPVTGKLVRRVREGADGKGPEPRAPRRRPTSLGGRLHGKGPHPHGIRDLAVQPTLLEVTPHQGVRESRKQGEGEQVIGHIKTERYA